ncbi:MAG: glutamate--cysteine ligase [Gammaproteobacteria bacterium]
MTSRFQERLRWLQDADLGPLLTRGRKGIEKECLRVTPTGDIADTPHPRALGSALTHPDITTDYSEALLEFRTPPCADAEEAVGSLENIHRFVYGCLEDEILWAASMPCRLSGDEDIPIARYGHSNVGKMKHIYRRGLGYRYGRAMQAIAGVHFNYSLPEAFWSVYQYREGESGALRDFVDRSYFGLVRNIQRFGWLVLYLFGASPAVCSSFVGLRDADFEPLDPETFYSPFATSLRMSDIGYKNKNQRGLDISYNDLSEYVTGLCRAIETPYAPYREIGVKVKGEYRQLNDHILQIENEYYGFVRPKQVARSGERPTLALQRRGVQYVELRALDLDCFHPSGLDAGGIRFLEAFMLFCLFTESPPLTAEESREIEHNQLAVARHGRDPDVTLQERGISRPFAEFALDVCGRIEAICVLLDGDARERPYGSVLNRERAAIHDPSLLPSARMLREMRERGESFVAFALRLSEQHARYFRDHPLSKGRAAYFAETAEASLAKQAEIERKDELSFEDYLERYYANC